MKWATRINTAVGLNVLARPLRRLIVGVIGFTIFLIGLAMVVLPGPAFIVIPIGLGILATEFAWARRIIRRGRVMVAKARGRQSGKARTMAQMVAMTNRQRVDQLVKALPGVYPDAHCELDFRTPLELLVATILSAQCTDKRVNAVTPALFAKYRTTRDYANSSAPTLERLIRSTGFFRNKTKSIRAATAAIVAEHAGRVPDTMEKLHGLPGVGRKTANVVLGNAFGKDEGIVVDTHVIRLSNRLRLTSKTDPEKIEQDLMKLVPRKHWTNWSHWLIWHGRRRCFARRPDCHRCEIFRLCPSGKVFVRSGEARPLDEAGPVTAKRPS